MREVYIELKTGRIFYRLYGEKSKGAPLIMLHGGPGISHDYLIPTAEFLSEERPVLLYDQLGCGKSDRPDDKSLFSINHYVSELREIKESLYTGKQVHILGQSWGTMLGVSYLLKHKNDALSLILSAPCLSAPMWKADQKRNLLQISREAQSIIHETELSNDFSSEKYQNATMEFYSNFVCRIAPWPEPLMQSFTSLNMDIYKYMWGPSEFTITGNLKNFDLTARLSEIEVPTLFTCGQYDEATPETTEYYSKKIPGSELRVFEEASHIHHLEKAEEYNKLVSSFLKKND